jgi:thermitase
VEFGDNVKLERVPGTEGSGHPSLDALANKYDVYEAKAVFPMPKEPINHPHGLWDWEDWQRSAEKARLKYVYVLRFRANTDPRLVAEEYKKDPYVLNASPEKPGESYMLPNDPDFDQQWYLYNPGNRDCDIRWPEGWDRFLFAPPEPLDGYPIAGVIDTGIYTSNGNHSGIHQDIRENAAVCYDMLGEPFPDDECGHGTAVAGIIAADTNNGLGIAGVGVDAVEVMAVRTHYYKPTDPYIVAAGMVFAVNMGADLLNMSWGFDYPPLEIQIALAHAWELDVVTVAASGYSEELEQPVYNYPASDEDDRMISIGGTERVPFDWSWWKHSGWHQGTVDVVAPAYPDIYTTWLDNGYANKEGTSYSCAMGSGIAGGCIAMLEGPYAGIDVHVRDCIHHGGANWGLPPDEKWGYGTEYYDDALDWAIAIRDGSDNLPGPAAAAAPVIRLAQNAPNPASSTTTIRVELSSTDAKRAELAIYDLSGRKVRTFDVAVKDGLAEVAWDLTAGDGSRVAPGVYIYRVNAGGVTSAKKCVVR